MDQVQQEKNVIDCAVAAGCTYIAKLGTVRSYTTKDSKTAYGRFHAEIEEHLENTAGDMKWTVFCPNWFMSNHLGDIFGTLPNGIVAYPVEPDRKVNMVDPRDVGDVMAECLLANDPSVHHGLKLDVCGPEAVCTSEVAALYKEALGRDINAVKCSQEAWAAGAVASGMPDWLAEAVCTNFPMWENGECLFPSAPEVLAVCPPKRTIGQWIKEWAPRSPPPASA